MNTKATCFVSFDFTDEISFDLLSKSAFLTEMKDSRKFKFFENFWKTSQMFFWQMFSSFVSEIDVDFLWQDENVIIFENMRIRSRDRNDDMSDDEMSVEKIVVDKNKSIKISCSQTCFNCNQLRDFSSHNLTVLFIEDNAKTLTLECFDWEQTERKIWNVQNISNNHDLRLVVYQNLNL